MNPADPAFGATLVEFPQSSEYALTPEGYAEHVAKVKAALGVPVIASLNGTSAEAWLRYARIVEQAGADALELNIYEVITDLGVPGTAVEHQLAQIVKDLKRFLRIPVAVKLSPFYTAFANVAKHLDAAGADGLVLFNRFYQPDIDVETGQGVPRIELSTSAELLLRLRWIAILHGRVRPSLAAAGGIAVTEDVVKAILAGADVVQVVSALLRNGPSYLGTLVQQFGEWMEQHQVARLDDMRGRASLRLTADRTAFERANYIKAIQGWSAAHPPRP
jgi:dihydroorotate dehydrogenase (fumarate)